jgi:ComF family protein
MESSSKPEIPPGLDSVVCGPLLDDATRSLVHGLKYHGFRHAARDLVELARSSVPSGFCLPDSILVPVPVHPHRRRERGYNQSSELAKHWSQILKIPVLEDALVRVVDTRTQTRLDSDQRRSNLEQVFRVGRAFCPDRPIVLVDDVLTTGATLSACAAALLLGGAPSVRALCAAWAGEA